MTSLLVLLVVVLLGVAVWQLTKIFDLTQIGANASDDSGIANDKDNNINGYLMFAFLVFIYITTIYCCVKFGDLPLMDNSASEHGTGCRPSDVDLDDSYLFCADYYTGIITLFCIQIPWKAREKSFVFCGQ